MKLLIENIQDYDETKYQLFYSKIKSYKKKRIDKIINKQAKYRSILGEYLLIKGLDLYYSIDYDDTTIHVNKFGKPFIERLNVYYNISHSYNYVICGFNNKQIGIDIEKIRNINIKDIDQFATSSEKKYILKRKKRIYQRAFEIYTLKEAYFKMKGENLNNIKNIEFHINCKYITCNDKTVKLKLNKKVKNYIIAICIKK